MNSFLETSRLTWDASRDLGPYLLVLEKARWAAGVAGGIMAIRNSGRRTYNIREGSDGHPGFSIFKMLKGA